MEQLGWDGNQCARLLPASTDFSFWRLSAHIFLPRRDSAVVFLRSGNDVENALILGRVPRSSIARFNDLSAACRRSRLVANIHLSNIVNQTVRSEKAVARNNSCLRSGSMLQEDDDFVSSCGGDGVGPMTAPKPGDSGVDSSCPICSSAPGQISLGDQRLCSKCFSSKV